MASFFKDIFSKITNVFKKTKKIPAEVGIGAYYVAETERLMEESIGKILFEDSEIGSLVFKDHLDPEFASVAQQYMSETFFKGSDPKSFQKTWIENIKKSVINRTVAREGSLTYDAFQDILASLPTPISSQKAFVENLKTALKDGDTIGLNTLLENNRDGVLTISEWARTIDDNARIIIKRNGLEKLNVGDLAGVTKEINSMFSSVGEGGYLGEPSAAGMRRPRQLPTQGLREPFF